MREKSQGSRIRLQSFKTNLGWVAARWQDGELERVSVGQTTEPAALRALGPIDEGEFARTAVMRDFERRMRRFAAGSPDDFTDVPLVMGTLTPFQHQVLQLCRQIPGGVTLSYAALAKQAGRPGAARAVGNVMASNRFPFIIPCHRVVGSGGRLGGYSGGEGIALKQRLLEREGAQW